MKILMMVAPEINYMMASVHKSLDHKREHRPLIGILSVATYLETKRPHHDLKFIDCRALEHNFDQMREVVMDFKPDIVGLSTLTFNYYDTIQAAKIIRTCLPSAKICIGGWHVSLYPKETLAQDCVDYVVIGEGERTFVELIDAIESKSDLGEIRGIGFKQDHQPVVTPSRSVERELDDIPFPNYDLTDLSLYSHVLGGNDTVLAMESSRGCPFACTFCDIRRTKFRFRSPEIIADELEKWSARGINSFFFVDDNFTVHPKRTIALFDEIRRRNLNIEFKISSRVDSLNEELMRNMVDVGVSRISVGIESSKQKYLDYMQKDIRTEQIIEVLAKSREVGLPVFAFMMLGLPGQTRKEMLEEADFLIKHKADYASFSIMTVYPKTELYRLASEKGDLTDDPWPTFALNPQPNVSAPYMNKLYSVSELKKIQLQVTRRFYFSPRILYNRVREVRSWSNFKQRAKLAMRFLGKEDVRV